MAKLINEAKRFQQLAGIITEAQSLNELNDAEQEVVDTILGEGINEGKFNPKEILAKLIATAKKGLLTAAIISSVLASCSFPDTTNEYIKDRLDRYETVDSTKVAQIKDENTADYQQALNDIESQKTSTSTEDILSKLTSEEGFEKVKDNRVNYMSNPGEYATSDEIVVVKNGPEDYIVYLRKAGESIPSIKNYIKNLSSQDAFNMALKMKLDVQ